jgi:hypothetical protein
VRRKLRAAQRFCRKGTFAVGAIIHRAVARLEVDEAFVALGVGDGFPFLAAVSAHPDRRCIGLDDRPQENRHVKQWQALRRGFETLRSEKHILSALAIDANNPHLGAVPIGVCFIGSSTRHDAITRLRLCEPHLAENALVLVENCNRADVRHAALGFINASRNQFRVLLDRRTMRHGGLTFGNGILLFQLLGRNAAAAAPLRHTAGPALVPAA